MNPIYGVPPAIWHVVQLWNRCQGGMGGLGQLPEAGGLNQQPAWLMGAFSALNRAEAEARKPAAGDG